MKKSKLAFVIALLFSASMAFADSTHVCQGNSCNDNGGSGGGTVTGTVNSTNNNTNILIPTTTSSSSASANGGAGGTGIGIGGAGGAGGTGTGIGIGGNSSASSSASGGNSSASGGAATSSAQSGGNVQNGGAQNVRGGDVNVNTNVRPAASAPSTVLTSVGTDNCLGSVGGSFGNGFISIGGATTTESVECNRRANSRRLEQLGMHGAAVALQCMNDEVRSAMKVAGTPCPQDQAEAAKQAAASMSREEKIAAAKALKESGLPNMGMEVNLPEPAKVSVSASEGSMYDQFNR